MPVNRLKRITGGQPKRKEMDVRHWHVGAAEGEGISEGVSVCKKFLNCALYFHIESISLAAEYLAHT